MIAKFKEWADKNLQGDPVIWAVVFALSVISILVVYSSIGTLAFKRTVSPEIVLVKHTFMVFLGLAAMWGAHKIDYRYYSKISRLALWISVPLLIYTFTNGTTINDAAWPTTSSTAAEPSVADPARMSLRPRDTLPSRTTMTSSCHRWTWTPRITPAWDWKKFHCTGFTPLPHSSRKISVIVPRASG